MYAIFAKKSLTMNIETRNGMQAVFRLSINERSRRLAPVLAIRRPSETMGCFDLLPVTGVIKERP